MSQPLPDLATGFLSFLLSIGSDPATATLPPWRRGEALQLGGKGDIAALRDLACQSYDALQAYSADDDIAVIAWVEAVTYARLAATHGYPRDSEVLVFLMAKFADWQRDRGRDDIANSFEAAGLNVAGQLADAGDESFADMIAKAADVLPSEIIAEASRQRAQQEQA